MSWVEFGTGRVHETFAYKVLFPIPYAVSIWSSYGPKKNYKLPTDCSLFLTWLIFQESWNILSRGLRSKESK